MVKINEKLLPKDIYSTTEVKTNKIWIDGKPIYRKVVDMGTLTDQTTLQISSGLNGNNVRIVKIYGYAYNLTNGETFPVPFIWGDTSNMSNYIGCFFENNGTVWCRTNRTSMNHQVYIVLEYTKVN